jgi:lysophospholipase L1-like esterase
MHLAGLLLTFALSPAVQSRALWQVSSESHESQRILSADSSPLIRHLAPSGRTGFVAFGDSYSAGIGTGSDGPEDDCRRGLGAYPQQIALDLAKSQGGNYTTSFQFLSCTGSTTNEVLSGPKESQIDAFNASLPVDFALLTLGGNDLGFFQVMNACVFRFYNFWSGTCEDALEFARQQIESREFEDRLQMAILEILDKVRWEKKPWFLITVTGYARFFNDITDACDEMSFGIWWDGPKLEKSLRLQMNALVLAVNAKLRKTIYRINSQFRKDKVLFVDYDKAFDGHRFCEPGIVEPDYGRVDTWFFLVGGPDNANNRSHTKPEETKALSLSSQLVDPESCLSAAEMSGDWGQLALCYMAVAKHRDPTLRLAREDHVGQMSGWYVPTYYGKTFHPRTIGQDAIKRSIYQAWLKLDS